MRLFDSWKKRQPRKPVKLNLFETHLAYYAYMTGEATKLPRLVGEPKPGESGECETEVEVGMDTGPRRGRPPKWRLG